MSVCTIHIRVRYGETDQMGVAHHGAYVNWLESGRVAYCRELGVPYSEVEQAGFNMAVADMQIRYKKPPSSTRFCPWKPRRSRSGPASSSSDTGC